MEARKEILSFESLLIGYISGKTAKILLPPLKAKAYQGELIAMIGQNGIGKSTLMRTLTGLQMAIDGTIIIKGKSKKATITNVSETPSNRFLARQNVLVKGAIIETDLGKARVTNRPSQEGQIQAILIE